jgi:hypothetical protein
MKKGQSLSINVIVIAALALLILLILFFVVSGRLDIFGTAIATCPGSCVAGVGANGDACPNPTTTVKIPGPHSDCSDAEPVCCREVFSSSEKTPTTPRAV